MLTEIFALSHTEGKFMEGDRGKCAKKTRMEN
jgi:hypothetical protein